MVIHNPKQFFPTSWYFPKITVTHHSNPQKRSTKTFAVHFSHYFRGILRPSQPTRCKKTACAQQWWRPRSGNPAVRTAMPTHLGRVGWDAALTAWDVAWVSVLWGKQLVKTKGSKWFYTRYMCMGDFFSKMSGFGQIWRIYRDVPINYGTLKRNLITHETLRCLFADKLIAGDSCWSLIIPNMEANYFEPQPFQCEDDSYLNRLSRSCVCVYIYTIIYVYMFSLYIDTDRLGNTRLVLELFFWNLLR